MFYLTTRTMEVDLSVLCQVTVQMTKVHHGANRTNPEEERAILSDLAHSSISHTGKSNFWPTLFFNVNLFSNLIKTLEYTDT